MIAVAETPLGRIEGLRDDSAGVSRFLGIRYAEPPVGALRWRPPVPVGPWSGVREAKAFGPTARQNLPPANAIYHPGFQPQDEDCLFLNVWTGAEGPGERRPVLIWFHLGAFAFGSGSWQDVATGRRLFDGTRLAQDGAVVVTLNYRLAQLGFLAHPWLTAESEHGASGNYGFMDQVCALRWVRDNIAAFGGDPDCVTIGGVSAGSASCNLHLVSPLSAGLFHRVACGSAGFNAPLVQHSGMYDRILALADAEARGAAFADALGVGSLDALRALPAETLLTAVPPPPGPWLIEAAGIRVGDGSSDTAYPIVDGWAIPAAPGEILAAGRHNDVPVLTGSPMADRSGPPAIDSLDAFHAKLADEFSDLAEAAKAVYPASTDAEAFRASGDWLSDRIFGWQNWRMASAIAAYGRSPAYLYEWHRPSPVPPGRYAEREAPNAAIHGVEMPYVFGTLEAYDWPWSEADRDFAERFRATWLAFMRTGDPNCGALPEWPPFECDDRVFHIADPSGVAPMARSRRFHLLDHYFGVSIFESMGHG